MVVDTSALAAILNDEPRQAFIDLIANAATRLISTAIRREPLLFK
jgi:uncharacterized protein with PIN domain